MPLVEPWQRTRFDRICGGAIGVLRRAHLDRAVSVVDVVFGLGNGFPPCCVVRFSVTSLLRPGSLQGNERGAVSVGGHTWVPCGVVHKATTEAQSG
jgi:sulfite exporter TauE/SafE